MGGMGKRGAGRWKKKNEKLVMTMKTFSILARGSSVQTRCRERP
jgi:hypothetical protein